MRLYNIYIILFGTFSLICPTDCNKVYNPPALQNNPRLLVFDGFLTSAPDSTYITLTRSRNILDSNPSPVESHATLIVEAENRYYNYTPYWLSCKLDTNVVVGISAADKQQIYEYLAQPGHLCTLYEVFTGGYSIVPNPCGDCREHGGTSLKPGFWP
jgi:hypothetical protein